MKRQSKAEEALLKQVRWLKGQMDQLDIEITKLVSQKEGLRASSNAIQAEISQLANARVRASAKAKQGA